MKFPNVAGRREDLGNQHFKSKLEANYARYLNFLQKNKEIYKWEYETETFWFEKIRRGCRSYKPDFKIWEREESKPYFVETKGYLDARSKTKLNRMRIYHPKEEVRLVTQKEFLSVKKSLGALIKWE